MSKSKPTQYHYIDLSELRKPHLIPLVPFGKRAGGGPKNFDRFLLSLFILSCLSQQLWSITYSSAKKIFTPGNNRDATPDEIIHSFIIMEFLYKKGRRIHASESLQKTVAFTLRKYIKQGAPSLRLCPSKMEQYIEDQDLFEIYGRLYCAPSDAQKMLLHYASRERLLPELIQEEKDHLVAIETELLPVISV